MPFEHTPDEVSHAKPADFTCGDCVHCLPGPNTQQDVMSRNCYRYPPIPYMAQVAPGQIGVVALRPEIRVETIACGEYEEDAAEDVPSPGLTS
jgi:hypothetical protein